MVDRENAIRRINLNDFDYLNKHVKFLAEIYNTENIDETLYDDIQYKIDCVIEDIYLKYLNRSILFTLPEQSKHLLFTLRQIIHLQLTLKTQKLTDIYVNNEVNKILKLIEITKNSYTTLQFESDHYTSQDYPYP